MTQPPAARLWGIAVLLLGTVLGPAVQTAGAAQGSQGLQDGWAVGDQGQVTGGQLVGDELNAIQQAGDRLGARQPSPGQCFTDWTSVGCSGLTALKTYDQVLSNIQTRNLKVHGMLSSESWYRTQDLRVSGDYFGLLDTNGNAKSAFAAYQQYATY